MQLLYPYYLLFGFVLLVPLVIHLFNLRRFKTVYYSDITLLASILQKSKRRKTLKEILVLITRLLLLVGVVIAFCYPIFTNHKSEIEGAKLIVLDNSSSTAVYNGEHFIFDEIKNVNYNTIKESGEYQFLSSGVKVSNTVSSDGLYSLINESEINSSQLSLCSINDFVQQNREIKEVKIFSPFATSFDLDGVLGDDVNYELVHFKSSDVAQVLIDSLCIEDDEQSKSELSILKVLCNKVGQGGDYMTKLFVNDELRGSQDLQSSNKGNVVFQTHFDDEVNKGVLKVYNSTGTEINASYFVIRQKRKYKVTLIDDIMNSSLKEAFDNERFFDLKHITLAEVLYEELLSSDMVFLKYIESERESLVEVVERLLGKGVKVCLYFDDKPEKPFQEFGVSCEGLEDTSLVSIKEPSSALYNGVFLGKEKGNLDLPKINHSLKMTGLQEPLLKNEFNESVVAKSISHPKLYFSLIDLSESSSFTRHSVFIPTVYQMLFSGDFRRSLYSLPNTYLSLPKSFSGKEALLLNHTDSTEVKLPVMTYGEEDLIQLSGNMSSGWYDLKGDSSKTIIAINEKRSVEDYTYRSIDDLKSKFHSNSMVNIVSSDDYIKEESISKKVREEFPLWKYFVLGALLFLCFEILVLKFKL